MKNIIITSLTIGGVLLLPQESQIILGLGAISAAIVVTIVEIAKL